MSLSNELFGHLYSTESVGSSEKEFNTYFKEFKKRGSKLYGRLIAMSKKLNNEDSKVDTYIKSLKAKVRILENPTGMVKNVTDNITAELLFNDVLCKYKTIFMNKGTARKHCEDHTKAIKSLLDSEAIIKDLITKENDSKRIVKNYIQLCKHVMWSTSRLLSRIRLEPYATESKEEFEIELSKTDNITLLDVSNEGLFDWFKKWREEVAAKKKEKEKQDWKDAVSNCFEGYYNWLAETEPPTDVYCISFKDLHEHILATIKLYELLKTSSPYKFKNRLMQTEMLMKVNPSVKGHYSFDTNGFSDLLDRSSKVQKFKGSNWDNQAKLKQMYKDLDNMDDMWYVLLDGISMHMNTFNSTYLNNSDKSEREIQDIRNTVNQWLSVADWVLERSTGLVKLICRTLNTM